MLDDELKAAAGEPIYFSSPESTCVSTAAYFPKLGAIRVWLKSGSTKLYSQASLLLFQQFRAAQSKGQFYNELKTTHPESD